MKRKARFYAWLYRKFCHLNQLLYIIEYIASEKILRYFFRRTVKFMDVLIYLAPICALIGLIFA
ncbi:MAG: hypothetical protein PHD00_12205, partial [Bacteroidales bacterium]|nr:hypothetical protein [Bacteroidales bacterium]